MRNTLLILAAALYASAAFAQSAPGDDITLRLKTGDNSLISAGLYRVGVAIVGKEVRWLPIGWSGHFATPEGISYYPWTAQAGRETILVHPPWREGTGDTIVEYRIALPNEKPITFTTGIAMAAANTEKSDGVTFRAKLIADGKAIPILAEHRKDTTWKDFSFDLSPYAGQTVTLRLESNPGPANDSSFDFGVFGDPKVTVGKSDPEADLRDLMKGATSADADVSAYANDNTIGIRPTTPPGYRNAVRQDGDVLLFESTSGKDKVTYRWDTAKPYMDGLEVSFRQDKFIAAAGGGPALSSTKQAPVYKLISAAIAGNKATISARYTDDRDSVLINIKSWIEGNTLVVETTSPDPKIAALNLGSFSRMQWRRTVSMPYLAFGQIMYLQGSHAFVSLFPDWTFSQAGWMEPRFAHYDPKTDGTRNKVAERVYITVAPHLAGALPNLPNPPSPFLKELSDRVIADIWGGTFAENAAWLPELNSYGMERLAIFNHSWQRGGYDNEYPTVLPANKGLGGDEQLKKYADTAKSLGYLWGLHENYVDFYPNSEAWKPDDVSLQPDGKPTPAWLNVVQSYGYKPTAIVPYAQKYGKEIHDRFGTTDLFLDVHSAVPPWFHVDSRATEPGAASFRPVWDAHIGLWKAERAIHGGPAFGEGANHFFWSGYLDGVEAQVDGGEARPLLMDFDLLKIRPLQLNHGMGYMERWLSSGYGGDWTGTMGTTPKRDRYRAMEVAYGHAGYLASQCWRVLPHAVREYYLVRPIMKLTTLGKVQRIEYAIGDRMVSADIAAVRGGADRAHVTYDNGLELWSNIGDTDWKVGESVIPGNGYLAKAPGLVSGTTRRNGLVSDYREGDNVIFADGRCHDEHAAGLRSVASVSLAEATVTGPRSIRVTYKFVARQAITGDYVAFVHFMHPGSQHPDHIQFQQDHGPKIPTSQWKAGDVILDGPYDITIPDGSPRGDYELAIGLWGPSGRLRMDGAEIGGERYKMATVNVTDEKITITPTPVPPPKAEPSAADLRVNADRVPVDFGKVVTCGSVVVLLNAGYVDIISAPHSDVFSVLLRAAKIDKAWRAGATRCEALDRDGKSLGAVPLKIDGDTVSLQVGMNGADRYRLRY